MYYTGNTSHCKIYPLLPGYLAGGGQDGRLPKKGMRSRENN